MALFQFVLPPKVHSSVQFTCSVVSDSLRPHGLKHPRPPCPSPTPRVYSNSCPLSWWCHPTISFSVVPFCSCLQSFPASGSFPMNWLFTSGGQSIEPSASAWVLPTNIQDWFPLGLTGSPCSTKESQESFKDFYKNKSCFLYTLVYKCITTVTKWNF